MLRLDPFTVYDNPANFIIGGEQDVVKFCTETDLSAQTDDLFTHGNQNTAQFICADMRLCGGQDVLWRTVADKFSQDIFAPAVGNACCQFSVGEGSGAALTKLHI